VNTIGKNLTAAGYLVFDTLIQTTGLDFSEDCLTINVWTKPQFEEKKAVLIWLSGGGFTSGASADPLYDGEQIVDQEDVIFISFKYVLWPNTFGYGINIYLAIA
jgi:cholinesterase